MVAYKIAIKSLPQYAHRYSPEKFTQPQLFACLVLQQFMKLDDRKHVTVDVKHKLIRDFDVTNASTHDSQVIESTLDANNSNKKVYADSAYAGKKISDVLKSKDLTDCIHKKGYRNRPLTDRQKISNRKKSKIRSRVEHVFGVQSQRAGSLLLRSIGIVRAKAKIGLRNLSYNLSRYAMLAGD